MISLHLKRYLFVKSTVESRSRFEDNAEVNEREKGSRGRGIRRIIAAIAVKRRNGEDSFSYRSKLLRRSSHKS